VLPLPGGQGWLVVPPPGQAPTTVILPLPGATPQQAPFSAAPAAPGQPQP
jgi:hypothetical protein